ncbi:ABC transporter substrate-binding protein [Gracilibacillus sp. S3-1-1]|uniref:ABC transporter substrate-binding protein n=1 Tax=Gracilibacillus pellucidus TaxID=3095368 RepID=A0ACC6M0H1_9BACI|nr:ABC transporter substrate-binding protein [Gracilibacillus sp. S3-1-1]MDX8044405.1 ABC transporter substrate-binding protein [Gracilibacillus sp. S3-1-1]
MRLLEHYQILFQQLNETDVELPITVHCIADLLSCSYRNAKIIIRKLEEENWIIWKSGKGRGNYSTIKLLKNVEALVVNEAKRMITPTSIDESIQLLKKYQINDSIQREFIDWIFHTYLSEQADIKENRISRLHFPSYRSLPILDPAFVCRRSENHLMRHLFSTLITFNQETNEFLPHLAHYWEHNDDCTNWIFYLQKGVRFHHGKEMTAEDVRYSFNRHLTNRSPYRWIVQDIKRITVKHEYMVEFLFSKPSPFFLHVASSLGGSIVPKDNAGTKNMPIGTGPYKVSENTEDKLMINVFNDYFLRRPYLDEIIIYFFPQLYDNAAVLNNFSGPEEMNFYHYPYQGREMHNFEKYTVLDRGSKLLSLNMKQGIIANNRLLRKAIYHLLSPEKMIQDLGGTREKQASHLLEKFEEGPLARSKTVGRKALSESGYNGETLTLISYNGAGNEIDARWIQQELLKEGITVQIKFYIYEQLYTLALDEQADLLLGEQLSYESDLYTYLSALRGNHSFLTQHISTTMKKRLSAIGEREEEAVAFLKQVEKKLILDYGSIHLYRINQFAFYPRYVKGVYFNSLGWTDFTKIWYKER